MTTEQKLKAIIQKQVDKGFKDNTALLCHDSAVFSINKGGMVSLKSGSAVYYYNHILQILLNTDALKAIYWQPVPKAAFELSTRESRIRQISYLIIDAYHSGKGNNYEEAINAAFELRDDSTIKEVRLYEGNFIDGNITFVDKDSLYSKSHRKDDILDTKYSLTEDNLNKLIKPGGFVDSDNNPI